MKYALLAFAFLLTACGSATAPAPSASLIVAATATVPATSTVPPTATVAPSATAASAPATVQPSSAAPAAAAPVAQAGHVGPAGAYPSADNPGAINPDVTQDNIKTTICVSGYTAKIRPPESYTEPLKIRQIQQYGYADTKVADYEEDHMIPLEVGGHPTDPKNLWPEPYVPAPGSHEKDRVENYLHDQVCSGAMLLVDAQKAVQTDWVAVYNRIVAGAPATKPAVPTATTQAAPAATSAPATQATSAPAATAVPPTATAKPAGQIVCKDGYVWPSLTRQGACNGHGGIAAGS